MKKQTGFDRALADFVNDMASGDAVRHLADNGMTVSEIAARLSFPTEKKRVAEMVWKHFLNTGKIRLEAPEEDRGNRGKRISYVREEGPYGKVSFRRVTEELPAAGTGYVRCSFGREMYRDEEGFRRRLEALDPSDREYILDLPWPLTDVWHVADERMNRIDKILRCAQDDNKMSR